MSNNNNSLVVGSMAQVAKAKGIALQVQIAQALESGNCRVIGVDTSYSMKNRDVKTEKGLITRYEQAVKELATLQANYQGTILVVSFSEEAEFCLDGVPSDQAGTNLSSFFDLVKDYDGLVELFVICDGELEDYDFNYCLTAAKTFQSKVNTIYIGNADANAQKRLKAIADAGKGQNASNVDTKDFAATVTLMLAAGN